MVKKYLFACLVFWIVVHAVFSWQAPGIWYGTLLGVVMLFLPLIFSCVFWNEDQWSCLGYVPLVIIPFWNNDLVCLAFFRCFSGGEAHGFASFLLVVLSMTFWPSLRCMPELCDHVLGNVRPCVFIAAVSLALVFCVPCGLVVFELSFLMLAATMDKGRRGSGFIVLCGVLLLAGGVLSLSPHACFVEVGLLKPLVPMYVYMGLLAVLSTGCIAIKGEK